MNSFGTYIFIAIRKIIFPFSEIEKFVPQKGKILDVGCGHGTLEKLLAKGSEDRKLFGIDPSPQKIYEAKKLAKDKNISFKATTIDKLGKEKFDQIIIIDVLYLMPYEKKLELLKEASKRLVPGGTLLLKEIVKTKSIMYYVILLEEFLMMNILKLTYSTSKKSEVLTELKHKQLLEKAGLKVTKTKKISALLPYPHTLFIATLRKS